jgi:methylmalonyl-CoA mutase N-terminal domain/subunit
VERAAVEQVRATRAKRAPARAQAALAAVEQAARGADNLVPPILEAVRALCTTGEISDALRRVFGQHQEG